MPYCPNCGAELLGKFCVHCGAPSPLESASSPLSGDEAAWDNGFDDSRYDRNANPYATGTQSRNNGAYYGEDAPEIPRFSESWFVCMKKSFSLEGRASRTEYWGFQLVNIVVAFVFFMSIFAGALLLDATDGIDEIPLWMAGIVALGFFYGLIVCPANWCAHVRRLHDSGRSGWWILITLVPEIGNLVLFILMLWDPTPGPNAYGLPPVRRTEV